MGRGAAVAFTGGSVGEHAAATAAHRRNAYATHDRAPFVPLTWYRIRTYRSAASGDSRPHKGEIGSVVVRSADLVHSPRRAHSPGRGWPGPRRVRADPCTHRHRRDHRPDLPG